MMQDQLPPNHTGNESVAAVEGLLVRSLAGMPENALLDEVRLAAELQVSTRSIRRMVMRHELPPPVRLGGRRVWLAGRVLAHINVNAEREAKRAARNSRRASQLPP